MQTHKIHELRRCFRRQRKSCRIQQLCDVQMNEKNKKTLLKLAREVINARLQGKEIELPVKIPAELNQERGVFVTLELDGELKGCIGYIEPITSVYKAVAECAVSAAFHDPRFMPVAGREMERIKIEISILSKPEKLAYKNVDDLLKKLNDKMGLIIKKGYATSTFLPQVWEDVPDKEEFLNHLCMKAGLNAKEWKK